MDLAFKFNPNHDPENGRFTSSGTGVHWGDSISDFKHAAAELYKKQHVLDWEKARNFFDTLGPKTYFGTSRAFEINRFLRNDRKTDIRDSEQTLSDWTQMTAKSFDTYGVSIPEGTEVYRAVSGDDDNSAPKNYGLSTAFTRALDALNPGDTFIDKGFVSTAGAADDSLMRTFGSRVMQITTKGRLRAMLFSREQEVLFEPGRTFTFMGKGKSPDGKITYYRMEMG